MGGRGLLRGMSELLCSLHFHVTPTHRLACLVHSFYPVLRCVALLCSVGAFGALRFEPQVVEVGQPQPPPCSVSALAL
jgi:hypothetical protein